MRIAEYKQIGVEPHEAQMPILDEEGNETGEFETVVKEVPVMGMVYRDATAEEEADAERARLEAEEYERTRPRTTEEKLEETDIVAMTAYVNSELNSALIEMIMEVE